MARETTVCDLYEFRDTNDRFPTSRPVGVIPLRAENQRDDSEGTLVQRGQRGDEQAFATLYQLHTKPVCSVCLRMTPHRTQALAITTERSTKLLLVTTPSHSL
jgi:hypothetical protein